MQFISVNCSSVKRKIIYLSYHDLYIYAFLYYYIMHVPPLWLYAIAVHTDLNMFAGLLKRSEMCFV